MAAMRNRETLEIELRIKLAYFRQPIHIYFSNFNILFDEYTLFKEIIKMILICNIFLYILPFIFMHPLGLKLVQLIEIIYNLT